MPATDTAINACDALLRLENGSGLMINISGQSNSVDLERMSEVGEFKPFGQEWRKRYNCGKDATIALRVVFSTANGEAKDILEDWWENGGERTFQINLPDGSIGSDRYEVPCILQSFTLPLRSDDANPIMMAAQLLPAGPVTLTTVAT